MAEIVIFVANIKAFVYGKKDIYSLWGLLLRLVQKLPLI